MSAGAIVDADDAAAAAVVSGAGSGGSCGAGGLLAVDQVLGAAVDGEDAVESEVAALDESEITPAGCDTRDTVVAAARVAAGRLREGRMGSTLSVHAGFRRRDIALMGGVMETGE